MEKMTYVSGARRNGVRGGSALELARTRRPRVERVTGCDYDPAFAPFADTAPDGALRPSGSWISMRH